MSWIRLETGLVHQDNDKRIQALHQLAQELDKAEAVAEPEQLAQLVRQSLKSNNSHVSNAALACLPPLFALLVSADFDPTRSTASTVSSLTYILKTIFSLLLPLDKLGDAKASTRELARESVISAGEVSLRLGVAAGTGASRDKEGPWQFIERGMQEHGFQSKNGKAREQALHFLGAIRCPPSGSIFPLPPLRPFTPLLLPLLSDSDSTVRSLALHTCIAVFTHPSVSPAAKADLKQAMVKMDVSKRVQEQILAAVLGGSTPATERSPSQGSLTSSAAVAQSSSSTRRHPSLLSSLPAAAFLADTAAVHTPSSDDLAPVFVASERDMIAEFEAMKSGFEGKETEHNWMARDRSIARIRGMLLGGVAEGDLRGVFAQCVREAQEGIIRVSSSLRTTLAISALTLMCELASALPADLFEPLFDGFLSHCLSVAGQTKKIVAAASQNTVTTLLQHSTYHHRTLQLILLTLAERTTSARQFAAQHILTVIHCYARPSKGAIEHTGGLAHLETALQKGLADANPQVRETSRTAFWEFERVWPDRAALIAASFDPAARKLLDKVRPTGDAPTQDSPVKARPSASTATAQAGGSKKPSVREMMMAARRQKAAAEKEAEAEAEQADAPERPRRVLSTLMPDLSPLRPTLSPARSSPGPSTLQTPTRPPVSPSFRSADNLVDGSRFGSSMRAAHSSAVSEPVDESLRDQAMQAEQTAQRLLEIAQDEESFSIFGGAAAVARTPQSTRTLPSTAMQTPANPAVRRLARPQVVLQDSPDPRDGSGAGPSRGTWWVKRTEALAQPPPFAPDSQEKRAEIKGLISSLRDMSIDAASLRKLSSLAKERPVRENDDGGFDGADPATPSKVNGREPGADDKITTSEFWQGDRRFDKVYEGVKGLLLRPAALETGMTRDAALLLLKDLVENQSPCFTGSEADLLDLLFKLREDPSRSSVAATEAIAHSFASRLEPLYGLGTLTPSLSAYLSSASDTSAPDALARSFALGLRLMGGFFEHLPGPALNDTKSADLRRAAIMALDSAQVALDPAASGHDGKLADLVGGLEPDQQNLLAYYVAKRRP
ncbi:armadillo-type fold domain containing protein [Rhodotorula toruloides]|uniref:Armadillo-type fold domain containing protein n=1 Tax=Rhodotorula toruloides TaxID=5286 RepID=A0A511KHM3_RHOTO|nr:armadillo-type fold domain containing protein [Rhodotorula toruloides]